MYENVPDKNKRLLFLRIFSQDAPLTAVELAQLILWSVCVLWFIPLILPVNLFELQNYIELGHKVNESVWTLVMGILIFVPILANLLLKEMRHRQFVYIVTAITRAGVFAFSAAMIYAAVPWGISAPLHALLALLSLWVVWRLADEHYS